ncbi:MAG: hypothetical protein UR26_C0002G0009 [candidate division TM6 bacterium GW2011_GWF2_32_72]|nr:MAG: hypothetical protein UR26_C0002G0009 [candidate division TM6 bacterium GW2011_GWF2_32_72]
MAKLNKEEVLKIARSSNLNVHESEIDLLMRHLSDLLTYAEKVKEAANILSQEMSSKNINIFREDIVVKTGSEPILAQAPETAEGFFVVPSIIEGRGEK